VAASEDAGLRFRVTDLRRQLGNREEFTRSVDLDGLRVGDAEVADDPVRVEVALEAIPEGVRVDGSVEFAWSGDCRRCLGPASGTATAGFAELFADAPEVLAVDDGDVLEIDNGWVDLTESVRDTVLLGLPLAPLCGPDCDGPAPDAFPVTVEGDPTDEVEDAGSEGLSTGGDPRWAALSELRFDPSQD